MYEKHTNRETGKNKRKTRPRQPARPNISQIQTQTCRSIYLNPMTFVDRRKSFETLSQENTFVNFLCGQLCARGKFRVFTFPLLIIIANKQFLLLVVHSSTSRFLLACLRSCLRLIEVVLPHATIGEEELLRKLIPRI